MKQGCSIIYSLTMDNIDYGFGTVGERRILNVLDIRMLLGTRIAHVTM